MVSTRTRCTADVRRLRGVVGDDGLKPAHAFKRQVRVTGKQPVGSSPVDARNLSHLPGIHAAVAEVGAQAVHQIVGSHEACLHFDANFASGEFARERKLALHRNAYNAHMSVEQIERDRLREALLAFWEAHQKLGLKSVRQWSMAAGLSPSTINPVLKGTANKRLEDETYFKLAAGAAKLLSRRVTVAELKGEDAAQPHSLTDDMAAIVEGLHGLSETKLRAVREIVEGMAQSQRQQSGE